MQHLKPLGESGSEVSHLILEPRNFAEVKKIVRSHKLTFTKGNSKGNQKPNLQIRLYSLKIQTKVNL